MSKQAQTDAITKFLASYKAKDVATRIALFADDISFEDPVGTDAIVGKAAMQHYFEATIASGWDIDLVPQKIIVNGAEAAAITEVTAGVGDNPPTKTTIVQHFVFDAAGKFKALRVFTDAFG
jgi:ketosteroid isomerase-like protein